MITLKPFQKSDAKEIVKWIHSEEEFRLWSANCFKVYPLEAADLAAYYQAYQDDDSYLPMSAWDQDGIFGHFFFKFLDPKKKHLRMGLVIVDDYCRGMGYGRAMVRAAMEYAFYTLKVEDVTLGVFTQNQAAKACYLSVGFEPNPDREPFPVPIGRDLWTQEELIITL